MHIVIIVLFFSLTSFSCENSSSVTLKSNETQTKEFIQELRKYVKEVEKKVITMNERRSQGFDTIAKKSKYLEYTPTQDSPYFVEEHIQILPDGSQHIQKKQIQQSLAFEKEYTELLGGLNHFCKQFHRISMYGIFEDFLKERTFTVDQLGTLRTLGKSFEMSYKFWPQSKEKNRFIAEHGRLQEAFAGCLFLIENYKKNENTILRITNFPQARKERSPMRTKSESSIPRPEMPQQAEEHIQNRDRSNTICYSSSTPNL